MSKRFPQVEEHNFAQEPLGRKPHTGPGTAQQSCLLLISSCFYFFFPWLFIKETLLWWWEARACSRWVSTKLVLIYIFLCCVRLAASINTLKCLWPVLRSSCPCMTEGISHTSMQRTQRWHRKAITMYSSEENLPKLMQSGIASCFLSSHSL